MSSVVAGGLFNLPKGGYNPETHKLLQTLMAESKLTNLQRQQVRETMKKGESLPVVTHRPKRTGYVEENLFGTKKNYYFMRRSQDTIAESGAYERTAFRPQRVVDKEKEKERLCSIFEHGKGQKRQPKERAKKEPQKPCSPEERLLQLDEEISERLEFLKAMQELGEGAKYETLIKQEIAAKLREMDRLNKTSRSK